MLRTRLSALVLAAALATGLAACNRGREATVPRATTTTRPPVTAPTITADDYTFTVSGPLAADRTSITMRNDGDELHEWKFARLRQGIDINEAAAAVQASLTGRLTSTTSTAGGRTTTTVRRTTTTRRTATTSPPRTSPTTARPTTTPTTAATTSTTASTTTSTTVSSSSSAGAMVLRPSASGVRGQATSTTSSSSTTSTSVPAGGLDDVFENADLGAPGSLLSPGEGNTISGDLDTGTYAVMCMLKASDGVTHVEKGMISEVRVEDQPDAPADPPVDRTVTINDGRIDVGAKDFRAGRTTFELTNSGEQKHNFSIVALNEGETLRSLGRFVQTSFATGPPATAPGRIVASVDTFEPGDRVKVTLDLKPGTYTVACTYRDDEGTEDHLSAFGEQTTITVT